MMMNDRAQKGCSSAECTGLLYGGFTSTPIMSLIITALHIRLTS